MDEIKQSVCGVCTVAEIGELMLMSEGVGDRLFGDVADSVLSVMSDGVGDKQGRGLD